MTPARMIVKLVDLKAGYAAIRSELLSEIDRVLGQMDLFLGSNVQAFEKDFAAYCGSAHGIGLSSGTDALYAALRACGVGPSDEVILPALTFFASVEAVIHAGAVPVFVDVEPLTLTLDPEAVRAALTSRTKAILPVHLYGQPVDMAPILKLAEKHDLRVVEDAAQAHGARVLGKRCGSLGDAGSFSFYFTKNLGAYGEAGFVTTNDESVAERIRLLRNHGHATKHNHELVGHNFRLDELQAAILRIKLRGLDEALCRRRQIAARYDTLFEGSPLTTLVTREGCESAHHLYPVRVKGRDALMEALRERGVETGIHYRIPIHRQPALRDHPHRAEHLQESERACDELLSLPLYPELTDEQIEYVASNVLECVAESRSSAPAEEPRSLRSAS